MHYRDQAEAANKWNRRKGRINKEKLILAFTDKDLCTPELLQKFDALPYKNKIVFTANAHPDIKHSTQIKHYAGQAEMGDAYTNYDTLLHVNFARLIDNCQPADNTQLTTLTNAENKIENKKRPEPLINGLETEPHAKTQLTTENARASGSV